VASRAFKFMIPCRVFDRPFYHEFPFDPQCGRFANLADTAPQHMARLH
jgi:hypothetical protein